MATSNSDVHPTFFFGLNVTECAAAFKPICFYKSSCGCVGGLCGPDLSVGTQHCNAKVFPPFLTLGAPQHLHVCFDFCAICYMLCKTLGLCTFLSWLVCDSAVIFAPVAFKVSDTGYCKL